MITIVVKEKRTSDSKLFLVSVRCIFQSGSKRNGHFEIEMNNNISCDTDDMPIEMLRQEARTAQTFGRNEVHTGHEDGCGQESDGHNCDELYDDGVDDEELSDDRNDDVCSGEEYGDESEEI